MRSNKIMSMILVLSFVFSSIPIVGLADASGTTTVTQPKFEVIGSTIKDSDKFFELTVKVAPGSKGFFSAGMTLQYDKSVITPVAWDSNGTVVPTSGCNDWQNVASVPAICPDELSGKTALVYEEPVETPTPEPSGNPTQPTESPAATESPQPSEEPTPTIEVTARDGEDPSQPTQSSEPTQSEEPTQSTEPTQSEEPTQSVEPTQSTEPAYEIDKENRGYMYISAEAALPITAPLASGTPVPTQTPEASLQPTESPAVTESPSPTPSDTPAQRKARDASATPEPKTFPNNGEIVTVRFMYVGNTADEMKANKAKVEAGFATKDGEKIVKLAPDDISEASPAGQMVFYGAGDAKDTEYYYTTDDAATKGVKHDELLKEAPVFTLEKDADSRKQSGGGADPSQFAALVFFDWDKTTLLGSMVVNGASSSEDIVSTINEYAKGLMAPEADGNKPAMGADWASEKAKECTTYDATPADDGKGYKYPLSSHDGYTFGKWIAFDSADYTVYGGAVSLTAAGTMVNINVPADPDFSNISGGLVLKAAYMANTKLDGLTSAASRRYTLSNKDDTTITEFDPNEGYYNRFGSSSNYSVKVKVKRINASGQPVHRTRQTALKATFNLPGGVQSVSLVKMEDIDEQIVEVAAPDKATQVTFTIIDIGGIANWADGSAARTDNFIVKSADYILYGNITYLNEYPETVDLNDSRFSAPAPAVFTAAGLDINVVANASGNATEFRRQAIRNIAEGQRQKMAANNGDVKKKYLTQTELQNAITHGHYLGAGH